MSNDSCLRSNLESTLINIRNARLYEIKLNFTKMVLLQININMAMLEVKQQYFNGCVFCLRTHFDLT